MKNLIISALIGYIYYGICDIKSIPITIIFVLFFWALFSEVDKYLENFKKYIKRIKEEVCEKW